MINLMKLGGRGSTLGWSGAGRKQSYWVRESERNVKRKANGKHPNRDADTRNIRLDESKSRKTISSTLDPLLERLSRDYVDDADLSSRLQSLFRVCMSA